jgi:hypothetical protein
MEIYNFEFNILSALFCVMPCIVDQCAHSLDWRRTELTGCH